MYPYFENPNNSAFVWKGVWKIFCLVFWAYLEKNDNYEIANNQLRHIFVLYLSCFNNNVEC